MTQIDPGVWLHYQSVKIITSVALEVQNLNNSQDQCEDSGLAELMVEQKKHKRLFLHSLTH